jgi:hypothetical protein
MGAVAGVRPGPVRENGSRDRPSGRSLHRGDGVRLGIAESIHEPHRGERHAEARAQGRP